ncbi:MAG: hypothetical protein QG657_4040 [Acidobacteriota bacterium]|nr:hypothetical protein [Acidobacteriota bacterium]
MTDLENALNQLDESDKQAAQETDEVLRNRLEAIKSLTRADLDKLRPEISDQETYDQLIEIVKNATGKNENLARIVERMQGLAQGAKALADKVISLAKV